MNALSLDNPFSPFPHISISLWRRPHPNSMPSTCTPFPLVKLSVNPWKRSLPFFSIFSKITWINSFLINLNSSQFFIFLPMTFKEIVLFNENANPFSSSFRNLSKEKIVLSKINCKILSFDKLHHLYFIVFWDVTFDVLWYFFLSGKIYLFFRRRIFVFVSIFIRWNVWFLFQHWKVCFQF